MVILCFAPFQLTEGFTGVLYVQMVGKPVWEISTTSAQFCCEPKMTLNNKNKMQRKIFKLFICKCFKNFTIIDLSIFDLIIMAGFHTAD